MSYLYFRLSGLPTANASLPTPVGWNFSYDYVVNEAVVDSKVGETTSEWKRGLRIAWLDLAAAALFLQVNRRIAVKYVSAFRRPQQDELRRKQKKLQQVVVSATILELIFVGLCGSAALYGTTLQSLEAADALFSSLLVTSSFSNFFVLFLCGPIVHRGSCLLFARISAYLFPTALVIVYLNIGSGS